jgi:predicted Fe-S protein YdhL (DUF1289 family)
MKIPSPCIDICKYKLDNRCTGCFMTKKEKKTFKSFKKQSDRKKFISFLVAKQNEFAKSERWEIIYRRKCNRKGINYNKMFTLNAN